MNTKKKETNSQSLDTLNLRGGPSNMIIYGLTTEQSFSRTICYIFENYNISTFHIYAVDYNNQFYNPTSSSSDNVLVFSLRIINQHSRMFINIKKSEVLNNQISQDFNESNKGLNQWANALRVSFGQIKERRMNESRIKLNLQYFEWLQVVTDKQTN